LELTDTPATYTGQAGKFPKVNSGETALEFADPDSIIQTIHIDNVSNPPTDAELDAAFSSAVNGETFYIDDNDAHTNFYQVVKIEGGWMIFTGVIAG